MKREIILGPPGTGKTTHIVRRLQDLSEEGIQPNSIALLSFTKAGAGELADRAGLPGIYASTIHSLAFKQAGIIREQVIGYHRLMEFSKKVGIPISGKDMESEQIKVGDEYLAIMQLGECLMVDRYAELFTNSQCDGDYEEFKYFVESYRNFKKTFGLVDFNDMLKIALKSPAPDFEVMFIDEGQDLSPLQWKLIFHWIESIERVIVAGDDDQSIYVWGGADPQGMMKFKERENAEVKILDQSYRVPSSIHSLANSLTQRIVHRMEKVYKPRDEKGGIYYHNYMSSDLPIDEKEETIVLYRNHSTRDDIEQEFMKRDIPYIVEGGKQGVLHDYKAQAINKFIYYQMNPNLLIESKDLKHMEKCAAPWHKIGLSDRDDSVWDEPWFMVFKDRDDIKQSYMKTMYKKGYLGENAKTPAIKFMTIHNSKGREADHIILINDMSKRTEVSMLEDPDSEIRTWYVAITRARRRLDIINGERPFIHLV